MLTKWAKNGLPTNNNDSYIPAPGTASGVGLANIAAKTYSGNDAFIACGGAYYKGNNYYLSQVTETTQNAGIIIGSDDTPATENDYCLGSQIYGSNYVASKSDLITYDSESDSLSFVIVLSITNNSDSAITIKEIGRFAAFDTSATIGGSISSARRRAILTDRTVLDDPLTIEAGSSGTIQYIFTYFNNSINNIEVKASKKK